MNILAEQFGDYFGDIRFLASAEEPDCRAVVDTTFLSFFAINYLSNGEIEWRIADGRKMRIKAPALYWTFPGTRYRYWRIGDALWNHFWVSFEGERVERLIESGLLPRDELGFRPIRNPEEFEVKMRELVLLVRMGDREKKHRMVHLLEDLLCESGLASRPEEKSALDKLVDNIRMNPLEAYHFKQIAADHGMSYSNFRLRFRQRVGEGPDAFVLRCRMRAAAMRLHSPGVTISEVAEEFGYENPGYFTRLFKRKMGLSPKAYRDAQQVQ